MSATTLPELGREFKSYAAYIAQLLTDRCDPAVAAQVVTVVAGLEAALNRQAHDEVDIELRLTALEERLAAQLEGIAQALEQLR